MLINFGSLLNYFNINMLLEYISLIFYTIILGGFEILIYFSGKKILPIIQGAGSATIIGRAILDSYNSLKGGSSGSDDSKKEDTKKEETKKQDNSKEDLKKDTK